MNAVPSDTDALEAMRTRMEAAENAGDPEPIIDLLADDAVIIVPTFPVSTGLAACAAFLRELLPELLERFDRRTTYVSDELDVRGDIAIDRGLFSFTVRPRTGGVETVEHGKYVFISQKNASGWKMWRAIATLDERDERRPVLRHLLAALAYRTLKALRDAPEGFADFRPSEDIRSPREIVRHMTTLLGYARTCFHGGDNSIEPLRDFEEEVVRFHETLSALSTDLASNAELSEATSIEQLLQGPLSDAMTHAGQLALLRRLAGSPIPAEDFMAADIDAERLGLDQPPSASPVVWPEAPVGWRPPGQEV
jgi:ketosteroid isomerase-like protein